ncbi:hypothetical protein G6F64_015111 [Rhizopus arrhizus]|uniref:Uncharacterized protein n=1 Tax=Rhizopus oryzae TaxID=64495 RepID=A0A9P6WS63_RHIOR|nr:hypothetical protein G6F64_015111 [Rhizopus arrhizus]
MQRRVADHVEVAVVPAPVGDVQAADEADLPVHHQDLLVVRKGDVEGIGAAGGRVVQADLHLPRRAAASTLS